MAIFALLAYLTKNAKNFMSQITPRWLSTFERRFIPSGTHSKCFIVNVLSHVDTNRRILSISAVDSTLGHNLWSEHVMLIRAYSHKWDFLWKHEVAEILRLSQFERGPTHMLREWCLECMTLGLNLETNQKLTLDIAWAKWSKVHWMHLLQKWPFLLY